MKITSCRFIAALLFLIPGLAFGGEPGIPHAATQTEITLGIVTIAFVDLVFLIALFLVSATLRADSKWSLAGALAENIDWPTASTGGVQPGLGVSGLRAGAAGDANGSPPAAEPRYESSSSRLTAFIGMLAVVVVFVGMANCVLWNSFTGGGQVDTWKMLQFLAGGSSLFVPYAVNQFRSAFEAFGGPAKKNP